MRFALRLAGAAALVLAPMSYATAQNAGKTLAMDFKTSVTIQGQPDTGVITGHAIGTADKMRLDVKMKGTSAQVSPLASDSTVSMIVTDTGKTIAYLDPRKNQYLRVRPADMIAQAQQMGGMKMEFTDTKAQVDSLGAGPVILGHPTAHYRIATGMTMTISAMGQQQTAKISSTNDTYYATDIKGTLNPFASMTGGDMANMFGTTNKDFADKMKAVLDRSADQTPVDGRKMARSVLPSPSKSPGTGTSPGKPNRYRAEVV